VPGRRGGLEPPDPFTFPSRLMTGSEFIDSLGLGEEDSDESEDSDRNSRVLGLEPPAAHPYLPPQGLGRGAMYSPSIHNQASTDNPYPVLDRSAHGITEADALSLPGTMAGVLAFNRQGRKEMVRNVEPPDPYLLDYLPVPGE
jgi:hypothetical protein